MDEYIIFESFIAGIILNLGFFFIKKILDE